VARAKLRIAVAGAGSFGREHLRALSQIPEVTIVGIAEPNESAAQAAILQFGLEKADRDAVAMIERLRPDGFIVATPGHTHVELASAALRLDIPVLLEKPVGLSAHDADLLIEAERASHAFVLPGHILRFSAPYRGVVDIVRSGEIGSVLSVSARNHRDDTHATRYPDIDPVLMTMVHDIDLALWITGGHLSSVLAIRRPENTARSETVMTGTDSKGCMWHISNAWTYPTLSPLADRVEVVGDQGGVEMELGRYIRVAAAVSREFDLRSQPDNMLNTELAYFIGCIAGQRRPEIVTLLDARYGLLATDAILESIRTGAVTAVRP